MSVELTETWAGIPSRTATRAGPWDSPAVSQRSMADSLSRDPPRVGPRAPLNQEPGHPHHAPIHGPATTPSSAPTSMNGILEYALLFTIRSVESNRPPT